MANWLLRLTDSHRNWGFGLCFLYLRNVKGFGWNHKREYPPASSPALDRKDARNSRLRDRSDAALR
ncbi:hypothetical protein I6G78_00370 (plasmid) [Burkholderia glumae]|uniref:Uncharacterized protein n=1 Tax=Burkholderia glumae TaxID=337 RepID=A0AAP9Y593_BURGL|nr:hypothetical protein I6H06_29365 [Burkholderia glumae]QQM89237.1 hypothetical protein I6G78_00370 [Burkholderia glumae]